MSNQTQILTTKVVAVTVFQDRAEVTREAYIELPAGNHTLIFDQLPDSIEEKSVQVSGKGGQASLTQVKFLTEYFEDTLDEEVEEIEKKRQRLIDEEKKLKNQWRRLKGQQKFLQGMVDRVIKPTKGQRKTTPQEWLKMLEYYGQKQASVDEAVLKVRPQVRRVTKALNKIDSEILAACNRPNKSHKKVEVKLTTAEEGKLQLLLSYVVQGASWEPYYDLRVSTETATLELVYKAVIRQYTEEAWEDAALRLSTARPHIGGRQPELHPWRIRDEHAYAKKIRERLQETMDKVSGGVGKVMKKARRKSHSAYDDPSYVPSPRPVLPPAEKERGINIGSQKSYDTGGFVEEDKKRKGKPQIAKQVGKLDDGTFDKFEEKLLRQEAFDEVQANKPVPPPPSINRKEVKVENGGSAIFFEIEGNHTVKNDNTEHQVTILQDTFAAHLQYSAVPKLSAHSYLRARTANHTDYPLLAGSTNIFLDGNFVSNASIDTIAPSEEFWTFLGIDEGVRVERKFLRKYEKKEGGLFSKKQKNVVYEYLFEAKNFKSRAIELIIKDQLPLSQNNEIKVELLKPIYTEDTDELKIDKLKEIVWTYKLDAGKNLQIPFEFAVSHPVDVWLKESWRWIRN